MPVPLSQMQANSFGNAVTITNIKCGTTSFVTTSSIASAMPYISPKPLLDPGEPSRERKGECSASSYGVSHDEMWAEFHCFWASHSDGACHSLSTPVDGGTLLSFLLVSAPASKLLPDAVTVGLSLPLLSTSTPVPALQLLCLDVVTLM